MVEFADRDELENWLTTQPKAVSVMIAARAALRIVPLFDTLTSIEGAEAEQIILPSFRAIALS